MNNIIALWAHPRSRSIALERVFAERGDFLVLHEPFSAFYYLHQQRAAAINSNLDESVPSDYDAIRNRIIDAAENEHVFFKDMSYYCHDQLLADEEMLHRATHLFLVRDPKPTIASHFAKNPHVTCEEIGYEKQASMMHAIASKCGSPPIVICAELLVEYPEQTLKQLCRALEITYIQDALEWSAGPREEWATWQPWHDRVVNSQGLHRQQSTYDKTVDNDQKLARFYQHHLPFYQQLIQHRLDPISDQDNHGS